MTTFDTVERSQQDACPAELYDFVGPSKTWRLTTYESDVTYLGNVYSAVASARSNISTVDFSTDQTDITVQIPASHELAQTYVAGVPMRDLLVTVTRIHLPFMVVSQFWQGYASSLQMAQRMASFRVPSGTNDALVTDIPAVAAQRLCNHTLYDSRCTILRGAGYTVTTTIASISTDGKTIGSVLPVPAGTNDTLAGVVTLVPWSFTGEILHVASGERRTVVVENSTTSFQLQAAFPLSLIHAGDVIQIFAGCTKTMGQCSSPKFNNGVNHGGHPYMPSSNIFYVGLQGALYSF